MKKITNFEKILHWIVLLSFLGLVSTALAAEYFFSKEAIMDSFKKSLPMLNITIAPADQFFISRIERRDTWDIHLYFGFVFAVSTLFWITINIFRKNDNYLLFKTFLFGSAIVLSISGIWMWLRLYYPLSEEGFGLLKKVHYYAYWTFIYTLIIHIIYVIYTENNKKRKGALSNMINFKNIASIVFISSISFGTPLFAEEKSDLAKWANDKNYIEGVMYIEGEKGFDVLVKEVSNCPYDKCKLEDIDQTQFGTKKIEIKKPDFEKAIILLTKSSETGNPLASEKLLTFLTKRIDYKSKKPNGYLVKQLKDDTGLSLNQFKNVINKTVKEGIKTGKSCFSEYLAAEMNEKGILGNSVNTTNAIEHYKKATEICPSNNLFKMLANGKYNSLKKSI
jgi:cytochrome b561